MARMSIDDKFLRDPNVAVLASLCSWSVRETRGCLLDVWAICYDQMTPLLSKAVIDVAATRPGFAELLVESELARMDRSGKYLIRGAAKRIAYLLKQQEHGRQGGLKRSTSQRNATKAPLSTTPSAPSGSVEGSLNLSTVTPTASVPDTVTASDTVTDKKIPAGPSTVAVSMAERLRDHLLARQPNHRDASNPARVRRWAVDIDLAHRRDHRAWDDIASAIDWVFTKQIGEARYHLVVESGSSLRDKFDRIAAKAASARGTIRDLLDRALPDEEPNGGDQ